MLDLPLHSIISKALERKVVKVANPLPHASPTPIVANRPDLPGKVPLIRPCPVSRPTERSFNGVSRLLPSRAENSCTLTLAS